MKIFFGIILFLSSCFSIYAQTAENCPEITVIGPSRVTKPGNQMTFTASISNGPTGKIEYEWTVTSGTIESGQGTATIEVRTTSEMSGMNVTATVNVKGLPAGCIQAASETAGVEPIAGCGMPLDEFGKLSKNDVKARIDNFYIQLHKDPNSWGLIFVELNEKESRAFKLTYLNNIYDSILFLKRDPARVIFVILQRKYDTGTKLWAVPPGADATSLTEGGIKIKGEEFKQKIKTLFSKTIK